MANTHSTPQPRSAKAPCPQNRYPQTRHLTILETVCEASTKIKGIGVHYAPVQLEPCALLRGKWLRDAGFDIGQKVTVTIKDRELIITPRTPSLSNSTQALND